MAKFIYKMQNILELKYKLEEQAKTNYGEARLHLNQEEEKRDKLNIRRQEYEEKLMNLMGSHLNIKSIKACEDAVEVMKYKIKVQQIAVLDAQKRLEQARLRLNEAMKERKIHEKLKENAFEAFKLEINAEEKKEVDELVSFQYSKKKDEEMTGA